jgi:hypothetical protein
MRLEADFVGDLTQGGSWLKLRDIFIFHWFIWHLKTLLTIVLTFA